MVIRLAVARAVSTSPLTPYGSTADREPLRDDRRRRGGFEGGLLIVVGVQEAST